MLSEDLWRLVIASKTPDLFYLYVVHNTGDSEAAVLLCPVDIVGFYLMQSPGELNLLIKPRPLILTPKRFKMRSQKLLNSTTLFSLFSGR